MFLQYETPQYFDPDGKRGIDPAFGQLCPSRSPYLEVLEPDGPELVLIGGFHCSLDVHSPDVTHKAGNNLYVYWAEWDDNRETD
jgi:hypothetical protein